MLTGDYKTGKEPIIICRQCSKEFCFPPCCRKRVNTATEASALCLCQQAPDFISAIRKLTKYSFHNWNIDVMKWRWIAKLSDEHTQLATFFINFYFTSRFSLSATFRPLQWIVLAKCFTAEVEKLPAYRGDPVACHALIGWVSKRTKHRSREFRKKMICTMDQRARACNATAGGI